MRTFLMAAAVSLGMAAAVQAQQPDLNAMMGALGSMMQGSTNAAAVADFRELKALLPADLSGMKRTKATGEKSSAMGMTVAIAEGAYSDGKQGTVDVKITDMGGTGLAGMMSAGWAMGEVDRETETGYERTTTVNGYKAMEKYDTEDKDGGIQVLVEGRFMIEIEGRNVSMDAIKAALDKIDVKKLASLKK